MNESKCSVILFLFLSCGLVWANGGEGSGGNGGDARVSEFLNAAQTACQYLEHDSELARYAGDCRRETAALADSVNTVGAKPRIVFENSTVTDGTGTPKDAVTDPKSRVIAVGIARWDAENAVRRVALVSIELSLLIGIPERYDVGAKVLRAFGDDVLDSGATPRGLAFYLRVKGPLPMNFDCKTDGHNLLDHFSSSPGYKSSRHNGGSKCVDSGFLVEWIFEPATTAESQEFLRFVNSIQNADLFGIPVHLERVFNFEVDITIKTGAFTYGNVFAANSEMHQKLSFDSNQRIFEELIVPAYKALLPPSATLSTAVSWVRSHYTDDVIDFELYRTKYLPMSTRIEVDFLNAVRLKNRLQPLFLHGLPTVFDCKGPCKL